MSSNYSLSRVIKRKEKLPYWLTGISNIGINVKGDISDNKLAVGRSSSKSGFGVEDDYAYLMNAMNDNDNKESPFFTPNYEDRRKKFWSLASHPEIEYVLHTICNESINYDDNQYFAELSLNINYKEEVIENIQKNFKNIYSLLEFDDGTTAWEYFLKFLVEGYLSFEIIYDSRENPKRIVGFNELDPAEMLPVFMIDEKTGKQIKAWKEIKKGSMKERILPDNSVIMISYNSTGGNFGKTSHVERMERSFNMMRIMELTKVGWHIMNSQSRMKIVLPVGTKSTTKAKQAITQASNKFKEDLIINNDNGEYSLNGQARINFGKTIVLPSRQGQEPEIEGVNFTGPDLSDMEGAEYFKNKFYTDSTLPWSRFDREGGSGTSVLFESNGVPFDEIAFYKSTNRLKAEFRKIILKPLYLQTVMDYPILKADSQFKSRLGLKFHSEHYYERAKQKEIESQILDQIERLKDFKKADDESPYFATEMLMEKYWYGQGVWSEEDKARNEELLAKEEKKKKEEDDFM